MFLAIIYLISSTFMITPEKWEKAKSIENVGVVTAAEKESAIDVEAQQMTEKERIERIRTDFVNRAKEILVNSAYKSKIFPYTFVIKKMNGNTFYFEGDTPTGYATLTLPDNVIIYDINRTRLGKDGKKHFVPVSLSYIAKKVPFILGIVGDLEFKEDGSVNIKKLEQVFYLGRAK